MKNQKMMERLDMSAENKVSVVVCTYNGEKYIKYQLESIIFQSRVVDEIIVCDDASSDKTVEIVNLIKEKHDNISWIIQRNEISLGVTKNFEKACSIASGEIVFFSDQDDIWEVNKVEKLLSFFDSNDVELVFGNAMLFDEKGVMEDDLFQRVGFDKKAFDNNPFKLILKNWYVTGATMVCRRSFIQKNLPFPDFWLHDQWLSFVATSENKIVFEKEKLTRYRQHNNQVVGAKKISFKEKAQKKVDYMSEAKNLQFIIAKYNFSQDVKSQIQKKADYYIKRAKIISQNRIKRIFTALGLLKDYKKYTGKVILSYAKDVIRK